MKCHRTGCDSPACWHVGLEVKCLGNGRRQIVQLPSTIKVCALNRHMEAAAAYILTPVNKTNIARGLMSRGYSLPDFASAEVVFVPIMAVPKDFATGRRDGLVLQ